MSQTRSTTQLHPLGIVRSSQELEDIIHSPVLHEITLQEQEIVKQYSDKKSFSYQGFCEPCGKETTFTVDQRFADLKADGSWLPNWRERVLCQHCTLNNRHRLMASVIRQENQLSDTIYMMEQESRLYKWVVRQLSNKSIIGSEYLGHSFAGGELRNGIRHENAQALSLDTNSVDLIVSNDVFEHLPDPQAAFRECCRVLTPKGKMFFTVPFFYRNSQSQKRVKVRNGQLQYLCPAHYHYNPVNSEGCLVYTDFSWDIVDLLMVSGFTDVFASAYSSWNFGHPGGIQIIFTALKK